MTGANSASPRSTPARYLLDEVDAYPARRRGRDPDSGRSRSCLRSPAKCSVSTRRSAGSRIGGNMKRATSAATSCPVPLRGELWLSSRLAGRRGGGDRGVPLEAATRPSRDHKTAKLQGGAWRGPRSPPIRRRSVPLSAPIRGGLAQRGRVHGGGAPKGRRTSRRSPHDPPQTGSRGKRGLAALRSQENLAGWHVRWGPFPPPRPTCKGPHQGRCLPGPWPGKLASSVDEGGAGACAPVAWTGLGRVGHALRRGDGAVTLAIDTGTRPPLRWARAPASAQGGAVRASDFNGRPGVGPPVDATDAASDYGRRAAGTWRADLQGETYRFLRSTADERLGEGAAFPPGRCSAALGRERWLKQSGQQLVTVRTKRGFAGSNGKSCASATSARLPVLPRRAGSPGGSLEREKWRISNVRSARPMSEAAPDVAVPRRCRASGTVRRHRSTAADRRAGLITQLLS